MKGHDYKMFKETTKAEHPPKIDIEVEKNEFSCHSVAFAFSWI